MVVVWGSWVRAATMVVLDLDVNASNVAPSTALRIPTLCLHARRSRAAGRGMVRGHRDAAEHFHGRRCAQFDGRVGVVAAPARL